MARVDFDNARLHAKLHTLPGRVRFAPPPSKKGEIILGYVVEAGPEGPPFPPLHVNLYGDRTADTFVSAAGRFYIDKQVAAERMAALFNALADLEWPVRLYECSDAPGSLLVSAMQVVSVDRACTGNWLMGAWAAVLDVDDVLARVLGRAAVKTQPPKHR